MSIEGTLDTFQLPEILQVISRQDKTGILTVQGEADIVAISFEKGKVVAADALNQTLEESLGEVLSGHGLVSPSDFAAVAAEHQAGNGRFLDLLVEREFIDREQLLEALRYHTYRLLIELLAWREGEFKFYSGDEVSYEEGFQPISVEELLIRSVEEAAGEGHPTVPDSRSVYEPAELSAPIRLLEEGSEPGTRGGAVWLTEGEKHLLDRMEGGYTVAGLVKKTGEDQYRVRFYLHRLLAAGAVRRRSPSQGVSAPAGVLAAPSAPGGRTPSPASRAVGRSLSQGSLPQGAATAATLPEVVEQEEEEEGGPMPLPAEARPLRAAERSLPRGRVAVWIGRLLALGPAVVLAAVLAFDPSLLSLPFPWQGRQRQSLEREMRSSLYLKLDRALKIYYLLEGRFPTSLETLVELGLLAPDDLHDPQGRFLAYVPGDSSYLLQSRDGGEEVSGTATEAVTGNFLLDPDFLVPSTSSDRQPLVLLD